MLDLLLVVFLDGVQFVWDQIFLIIFVSCLDCCEWAGTIFMVFQVAPRCPLVQLTTLVFRLILGIIVI